MPGKYLLCALSISMIRFCNDIAQIVEITHQDSIVGSIAQLLGLSPFELCLALYFFEEASSPFPVLQISGARITLVLIVFPSIFLTSCVLFFSSLYFISVFLATHNEIYYCGGVSVG